MNRKLKLLVTWNIVLTTVLFLSVFANASFIQAASDPPIKVFTASADDVGGGGGTGGAVTLDSTSNKTLATVNANLSPNHNHICMVTGSAAVVRYGAGTGYSQYNLQMDNAAVPNAARMTLGYFAGDPDAASKSITTNYGFYNVVGPHTFKFVGAKSAAGATNVSVNNSSMIVVCLKKQFAQ